MKNSVKYNRRLAVVLFNLGGPDGPSAVRPFLYNLFKDPAIISAPAFIRYPLAVLISTLREKSAKANYALMGGGSPLLPETQKQANALEDTLTTILGETKIKVFTAMRYWHPFTEDVAKQVAEFVPDDVVLLPLYPQFSTTTTGSSLKAFHRAYRGPGKISTICCYPDHPLLAKTHADVILKTLRSQTSSEQVRILFSAHGLPEKVVQAGDPYQIQVETTVASVVSELRSSLSDVDYQICYQSRVGPLKWIGPSTTEALEVAAKDNRDVLVVPIAFVSEHIETLVELDIEYAELAKHLGIKTYLRAPALGNSEGYIATLTQSVLAALETPGEIKPSGSLGCKQKGSCQTICPAKLSNATQKAA